MQSRLQYEYATSKQSMLLAVHELHENEPSELPQPEQLTEARPSEQCMSHQQVWTMQHIMQLGLHIPWRMGAQHHCLSECASPQMVTSLQHVQADLSLVAQVKADMNGAGI